MWSQQMRHLLFGGGIHQPHFLYMAYYQSIVLLLQLFFNGPIMASGVLHISCRGMGEKEREIQTPPPFLHLGGVAGPE